MKPKGRARKGAATPSVKRPRKPRAPYVPIVAFERMYAMMMASGFHAIGKEAMSRESALEIHAALRKFHDWMLTGESRPA